MDGLVWLLVGYLLGSFPSAYLSSRLLAGRDIREVGSGNVGGMNAFRNASPAAGIATAVLDVGKAALAVWLAGRFGSATWGPAAAAAGAVAGHNWMLFLKFKGGKGLGVTIGALLVLSPLLAVAFLALIGVAAVLAGDTNVGSGLAALFLPVLTGWAGAWHPYWVVAGFAMAVCIMVKHAPDFKAYQTGRRRMV